MLSHLPRVAMIPWPQSPGCYLVVSGKRRKEQFEGPNWHNEKTRDDRFLSYGEIKSDPCISFTYVQNGVAAEWDGAMGPIQVWRRYDGDPSTVEGATERDGRWTLPSGDGSWMSDTVLRHWIWPYATGLGAWSQMAVDSEGLPQDFIAGNYEYIFRALKRWAQDRLTD